MSELEEAIRRVRETGKPERLEVDEVTVLVFIQEMRK